MKRLFSKRGYKRKLRKQWLVTKLISAIGVACFIVSTVAFMLNLFKGPIILEGWGIALYSLYCKDRYLIYQKRKRKA